MEISEAREGRAVAIQAVDMESEGRPLKTIPGQIRSVDSETGMCVFRRRDGREFPVHVSSLRRWARPQNAKIDDVVYIDYARTYGMVTDIEPRQLEGESGYELVIKTRENRSARLFVAEKEQELLYD